MKNWVGKIESKKNLHFTIIYH